MFLLAPDKYSGERNMLFLWTVLGILFSAGGVWGQNQNASSCFGMANCDSIIMSCFNSRRIFILKMLYGFKKSNITCSQMSSCNNTCCHPGTQDYYFNYTDHHFGRMYENHNCWNWTSCSSQVQWSDRNPTGYSSVSTYAVAYYSCLRREDITSFQRNTSTTAPAVAIHYDSNDVTNYPVTRGDNQTWHCQVDTANCVQRQADVILVMENYTGNPRECSSMRWSGGTPLPCVPKFQYLSFNTSTPFHVSVDVIKSKRYPNGWAVVRAQDGSDLRVTCGYTDPTMIPPCPGMTTQSTTTVTTTTMTMTKITTTTTPTTRTTAQTASPQGSSYSTSRSASSTAPSPNSVTLTSSFSTLASHDMTSSSPAGQTGQSVYTTPAAADGSTGPIVGGVVAAVVVLVAAVLGVFCYTRRRGQKHRADTKPPDTRKSSMHVRLTSVTPESPSSSRVSEFGTPNHLVDDDGDYDRILQGPKSQNGHPTAPGIHGNPWNLVDPNYDKLGDKKPQSSSSNTAATYGRLREVGGGGEDTDYSYDHLARGRQADVIDSDYDTSALHMTSEGDYNVAGIPKKQHVITGSDYDTAEIVTSEGDYNRVDFQGRKQHVITGSDYDTAEIVTSEGDYNKVDFQGKKQKVITGSEYDMAALLTSDNTDSDGVTPGASTRIQVGGANYEVAKPIVM